LGPIGAVEVRQQRAAGIDSCLVPSSVAFDPVRESAWIKAKAARDAQRWQFASGDHPAYGLAAQTKDPRYSASIEESVRQFAIGGLLHHS
jgi:hypothetical protein